MRLPGTSILFTLVLGGAALLLHAFSARWSVRVSFRPLLLRKFYWLCLAPLYAVLAFYLLWNLAPIVDDGYGPEPGLYWGKPALPTEQEYNADRAHFLFWYLVPYGGAAAGMTLLGCGAPAVLSGRSKLLASHPFRASSLLALILFLVAAAISDAGGALGFWFAPRFIAPDPFAMMNVLATALPPTVLTGVLALLRQGLRLFPDA